MRRWLRAARASARPGSLVDERRGWEAEETRAEERGAGALWLHVVVQYCTPDTDDVALLHGPATNVGSHELRSGPAESFHNSPQEAEWQNSITSETHISCTTPHSFVFFGAQLTEVGIAECAQARSAALRAAEESAFCASKRVSSSSSSTRCNTTLRVLLCGEVPTCVACLLCVRWRCGGERQRRQPEAPWCPHRTWPTSSITRTPHAMSLVLGAHTFASRCDCMMVVATVECYCLWRTREGTFLRAGDFCPGLGRHGCVPARVCNAH